MASARPYRTRRLAAVILNLTLSVLAAAGVPATAAPRSATRAVAAQLHLTSEQETEIRAIIGSDRRNGTPTTVTRRSVLRVLTPEQRVRLAQLVDPPACGKPR